MKPGWDLGKDSKPALKNYKKHRKQNILRGNFMSIARIIWCVSALAAIVLAFVSDFAMGAAILAVLGLVSGFFVDHEHRSGLIIAAVFLSIAGGAAAWGAIPGVGEILTKIFSSYSGVLSAAALMAIARTTVERLLLNKNTAD